MIGLDEVVGRTQHRPNITLPTLSQERALADLAAANRWPFWVLDVAPPPQEPRFHNGWWTVPAAQDRSPIPAFAMDRLQTILASGIRPKAILIAHEAKPQLAPPAGTRVVPKLEYWLTQAAGHSDTIVNVAGTIVSSLAALLLAAGIGMGALTVLGVVGALMIVDPCLIIVTENNTWIAIAVWDA